MNPAEVIPFEDKGNKKIRVGNSPIVSNCPVYDLFHTQQDPLLMRYWVHQYATWLFPRESYLGLQIHNENGSVLLQEIRVMAQSGRC